jgi:spermidine synthase
MNDLKISHSNHHVLLDLRGAHNVEDPEAAQRLLNDAAGRAGLTVLAQTSHKFERQGLTAAVLLVEGHCSLHTWPEHDYIALDYFLRETSAHEALLAFFLDALEPREVNINELPHKGFPGVGERPIQAGTTDDDRWFWEDTMPGDQRENVIHSFKIQELIYRGRSPIQSICIFDNLLYGRMLVLDGIIQMADSDAFIYNEMLVHSVLLSHQNPQRILVVGSGTGGALRECFRHDVANVVLVEIDRKVIDVCREFFPRVSQGAFDDPRLEIRTGDARELIKEYQGHFDIVMVDSSDCTGPSEPLYDANFYQDVHRALKPEGLVALQVGSLLDRELLEQTNAKLGRVFHNVTLLRYSVSSFNCGECCFMIAGQSENDGNPSLDTLQRRRADRLSTSDLRYYTPEVHLGSQIIPSYLGL